MTFHGLRIGRQCWQLRQRFCTQVVMVDISKSYGLRVHYLQHIFPICYSFLSGIKIYTDITGIGVPHCPQTWVDISCWIQLNKMIIQLAKMISVRSWEAEQVSVRIQTFPNIFRSEALTLILALTLWTLSLFGRKFSDHSL